MPDFVITSENTPQIFSGQEHKGGTTTYQFDLKQWAEENSTITSAAWVVKTGQVTIAGKTLSSEVVSAQISCPQAGWNIVEITITTAKEIYIIVVQILVRDLKRRITDYGLCPGWC